MSNYLDTRHISRFESKTDYAALTLLFARIGLATNFLLFGALKFIDPQRIWDLCVAHGLPGYLVYPAMILQLVGGLLILLGLQTRIAAALFVWFCIVAPSLFWLDNLENFTRDYATAGGFLLLLLFGAGPISLDAKLRGMRDFVTTNVPFILNNQTFIDRAYLVARALIALPFLADVANKALYMGAQRTLFASNGIPADTIYVVMMIEIVFGLMVLVGYRTSLAALALLVWAMIKVSITHYPGFGSQIFKEFTTIASLLILFASAHGRIARDARSDALDRRT